MHKDLLYLVSSHLTDRDRLKLKLYCHTVYFKFINDFKLCCINNYIISIKILSLTNDIFDWNWGLLCACWGGHRDLVDFMIEKGASHWDYGLKGACRGGACCAGGHCPHCDIVDLMIEKGAGNWNWGLEAACQGGYRNLVDLMIQKGANYWNWGLVYACMSDHSDIVKLMISKGATLCMHCRRNMDDHLI